MPSARTIGSLGLTALAVGAIAVGLSFRAPTTADTGAEVTAEASVTPTAVPSRSDDSSVTPTPSPITASAESPEPAAAVADATVAPQTTPAPTATPKPVATVAPVAVSAPVVEATPVPVAAAPPAATPKPTLTPIRTGNLGYWSGSGSAFVDVVGTSWSTVEYTYSCSAPGEFAITPFMSTDSIRGSGYLNLSYEQSPPLGDVTVSGDAGCEWAFTLWGTP